MTITASIQLNTVNLHGILGMKAYRSGVTTWLEMRTSKGEVVNVFMPYDMASEIADLWNDMNSEPEPPTFDETLGAKCDAEARLDEARKLKGMV